MYTGLTISEIGILLLKMPADFDGLRHFLLDFFGNSE